MKYNEIPQHISGIYKINFPNNKIYIGRAINIRRRISEHFRKEDNTACYAALHKYYSKCEDIEKKMKHILSEIFIQKEKSPSNCSLYRLSSERRSRTIIGT
jgi:excinuclease UvrABC nuclease subunit